jgi:hypothetical protein
LGCQPALCDGNGVIQDYVSADRGMVGCLI